MIKLKSIGFVLGIVAALAAGTLGGRWVAQQGSREMASVELDPGAAPYSTDAIVLGLQNYIKSHAADGAAYARLGTAYLQKARETGDPTFYLKADGALRKALELDEHHLPALIGMGSLALARHQFQEALEWGQRAHALNPYSAAAHGIMGDAQIELGRYSEGFETFQRMVDQRPDLASYARISYARELVGDRAGAIEAMQQAVEAGIGTGEAGYWARVQLGNLYLEQGDLAEAEQAYQVVLNAQPSYAYAQAGLANVRAAQGNITGAISMYASLVGSFPLPQFVIALGDLYMAAGRPEEAARQYDLVEAQQRLYAANDVDVDAEMALFNADHNRNLPEALERARAGYARRPGITTADILAWTLYKSGRYAEAQEMMGQALRLGTRNALFYFHAGMIACKLGDREQAADYLAAALDLDPHFSTLHAGKARALLAQLGAR